jgi:hypothetical protein
MYMATPARVAMIHVTTGDGARGHHQPVAVLRLVKALVWLTV